jgi:hypothetical protein
MTQCTVLGSCVPRGMVHMGASCSSRPRGPDRDENIPPSVRGLNPVLMNKGLRNFHHAGACSSPRASQKQTLCGYASGGPPDNKNSGSHAEPVRPSRRNICCHIDKQPARKAFDRRGNQIASLAFVSIINTSSQPFNQPNSDAIDVRNALRATCLAARPVQALSVKHSQRV